MTRDEARLLTEGDIVYGDASGRAYKVVRIDFSDNTILLRVESEGRETWLGFKNIRTIKMANTQAGFEAP